MSVARAYAPASVGNVAAGFDILGAALAPLDGSSWGDVVEIQLLAEGASTRLEVAGPFAAGLPAEPAQNLVFGAHELFRRALAERGRTLSPCRLRLLKNLPLASGLGSSASSIVASLVASNALAGEALDRAELLRLAGLAEASHAGSVHLDNVAPALLGGLQMVLADGTSRALPFPPGLVFVLVSPALELSTAKARAALPAAVPLALTIGFAQNLAAFISALERQDLDLLRASLRDLLAEPHRAELVPGFRAAQRAALAAGALGGSLSGAGPATFALAAAEHAPTVAAGMVAAFRGEGIAAAARLCGLDPAGARLLAEEAPR